MEQQSNFLFGKPVKWQQSLWYQMKCLLRYRGAADFHKEYRLCSSSSGILLIVVLSCLIHHTVPISSKSRSYVSFSIYINNGGSTSFRFTWTIRKIAPQHTDIFIALFPPRLHTYHFHFGQDIAVGIGVIFSAGLHISWVSYHQPMPFDIMNFWTWYERCFCVPLVEVLCLICQSLCCFWWCVTTNYLKKNIAGWTVYSIKANKWSAETSIVILHLLLIIDYLRQQ